MLFKLSKDNTHIFDDPPTYLLKSVSDRLANWNSFSVKNILLQVYKGLSWIDDELWTMLEFVVNLQKKLENKQSP